MTSPADSADLSPENFRTRILYGPGIQTLIQGNDCSVYKMENQTGEGIITRYPVFPGIELLYNDIHMSDGLNHNKLPQKDIMEINHCREGRFECAFPDGKTAYLGAGDLAINMLSNTTSGTWFPLAHYHGISIVINLPEAAVILSQIVNLFDGMPIDLSHIRDRLCQENTCFIMRATDRIQHIFSELYTAPEEIRAYYFKLKVIELLLFLNGCDYSAPLAGRAYFAPTQVALIRAIRNYLIDHLDQQITLSELSDRFQIPLTSMKLCFKGVYDTSIHAYMQTYRMQKAAALLIQTDQRITDIAAQLGYKNTSKFAEAFKQILGSTPSAYRKSFCPNRAESDQTE